MKSFKVMGEKYPLENTSSSAPDAYSIKGKLLDDEPKGRFVGYVTMVDGSVVACYKKMNLLPILLLLVMLCGAGGFLYWYYMTEQPKDVVVAGITIKEGVDNNVVKYNGFTAIRNGEIFIYFTNGSYPCTIQIVGDGITCDKRNVASDEYVESMPVQYDTLDALVNAKLVITTATSTQENDIVVEIPDNNTANSPTEGLEGYWQGEYIYGY